MSKTVIGAVALAAALTASANTFKFPGGGDYDWNVNTNWDGGGGGYPNGVDAVGDVAIDLAGWQAFYFNEEITLGALYYGDTYGQTGGQTFYAKSASSESVSDGLLVMKSSSGPALICRKNANHSRVTKFYNDIRLDSDTLFDNGTIGGAFEVVFAGAISGSGSVIKINDAKVFLGEYEAHANTYAGDTIVSNGILYVNKSHNVCCIPGNVTIAGGQLALQRQNNVVDTCVVTLENDGTFNVSGYVDTIRGIQGDSAASTVYVQGGNLTLVDDVDRTYAGKLTGDATTGVITKQGVGLWTLSGDVSYGGRLAVNETGGILADTLVANATVSLADGGVLGGAGVVSQQVACVSGVLAPGSLGTGGTLELAGGIGVTDSVAYRWKLGELSETQGYGRLVLSGGASTLGADRVVTLDFSGLDEADRPDAAMPVKFWRHNHRWTIFEVTGEATCDGAFTSVSNGTGWGERGKGVFRLVTGENGTLVLDYTAPVSGLTVIIK